MVSLFNSTKGKLECNLIFTFIAKTLWSGNDVYK